MHDGHRSAMHAATAEWRALARASKRSAAPICGPLLNLLPGRMAKSPRQQLQAQEKGRTHEQKRC